MLKFSNNFLTSCLIQDLELSAFNICNVLPDSTAKQTSFGQITDHRTVMLLVKIEHGNGAMLPYILISGNEG